MLFTSPQSRHSSASKFWLIKFGLVPATTRSGRVAFLSFFSTVTGKVLISSPVYVRRLILASFNGGIVVEDSVC